MGAWAWHQLCGGLPGPPSAVAGVRTPRAHLRLYPTQCYGSPTRRRKGLCALVISGYPCRGCPPGIPAPSNPKLAVLCQQLFTSTRAHGFNQVTGHQGRGKNPTLWSKPKRARTAAFPLECTCTLKPWPACAQNPIWQQPHCGSFPYLLPWWVIPQPPEHRMQPRHREAPATLSQRRRDQLANNNISLALKMSQTLPTQAATDNIGSGEF